MTMANVLNRPQAVFLKQRDLKTNRLLKLRTAFRESGYQGLRGIDCEWQAECLVLQGKTMSYFLKQMAQELVFHMLGRIEIRNEIEVAPPECIVFID